MKSVGPELLDSASKLTARWVDELIEKYQRPVIVIDPVQPRQRGDANEAEALNELIEHLGDCAQHPLRSVRRDLLRLPARLLPGEKRADVAHRGSQLETPLKLLRVRACQDALLGSGCDGDPTGAEHGHHRPGLP